MGVSFAAERDLCGRRCHVCGYLHPVGQGHGRLGPSRRLSNYDCVRNPGFGSDGRLPEPSHVLCCICKIVTPVKTLSVLTAGQVFYSIGFGGMTYCVDVITSDASKLKNRGLAYAFTSSPYIITAFAGPKAADDFYYNVSWRWGFGCFTIIFPVVAAPLYCLLKWHVRKADKQGMLTKESSGRTFLQNVWHWTMEFDRKTKFSFTRIYQTLTIRSIRRYRVLGRPHRFPPPF